MADSSTVVGQTILVKGNLEGDEDLTVQGRIEGSINLSRTLIVEPNGVVKADVTVSNAVISGVMVGNLTASDSVEIAETGRMVGDIKAPRVIIVEGALFKGNVDMGNLEMPRPSSTPSTERKTTYSTSTARRPQPAKPAPRPEPPKPASSSKKSSPASSSKKEEKKKDSKSSSRSSKKKVVVKKKRR